MSVDLPPAVPLVCTIQTVDSLWSQPPMTDPDIDRLKRQEFLLLSNPARMQPPTVVVSGLTPSAQHFSSSGVDQSDPSQTTYHWSFDAPLKRNTRVTISGDLIIRNRQSFQLNQQSRLTTAEGTRTLNTLQETARGRCRDQR